MMDILKCVNCRSLITEGDARAFRAEMIRHGYTGAVLDTPPDLCACCSKSQDIHNAYLSEFLEP